MTRSYAPKVSSTLILGLLFAGCDASMTHRRETGAHYPPVTAEQLAGKSTVYRKDRDDASFTWVFEADRFLIEGDNIPADLVVAMLGPDGKTQRIEGNWNIVDGNIYLEVKTDQPEGSARQCSFAIYSTGVIRIDTGAAQYVFTKRPR